MPTEKYREVRCGTKTNVCPITKIDLCDGGRRCGLVTTVLSQLADKTHHAIFGTSDDSVRFVCYRDQSLSPELSIQRKFANCYLYLLFIPHLIISSSSITPLLNQIHRPISFTNPSHYIPLPVTAFEDSQMASTVTYDNWFFFPRRSFSSILISSFAAS